MSIGTSAKELAIVEIQNERDRQDQKWGEQNHGMEWWLAILMEEVGELSQATLEKHFGGRHGTDEQIMSEAIQVAAVAQATVECLIRKNGRGRQMQQTKDAESYEIVMDFDRGEQYFRVVDSHKKKHVCLQYARRSRKNGSSQEVNDEKSK